MISKLHRMGLIMYAYKDRISIRNLSKELNLLLILYSVFEPHAKTDPAC